MKSINMLVFSDEEFFNISAAADTFCEWGVPPNNKEAEEWVAEIVNDLYGSYACPNSAGWIDFFYSILRKMAARMTLEEN